MFPPPPEQEALILVSPTTRQLQTPTNLILLSLAVSDLLVGAAVMPLSTLMFQSCVTLRYVCTLQILLSLIITSASIGNMVLISVDRYLAICFPLQYPLILTTGRVKIGVSLCWFISVVYNIVMMTDLLSPSYLLSNPCPQKCEYPKNHAADMADFVISLFVPLTVIIVLYTRVFVVAMSQVRILRSQVSVAQRNTVTIKISNLKAARTLGIVLIMFILTFFPYYIPQLLGFDSGSFSYVFQLWLFYSNSTVNPIIYALLYPWFRKAIRMIVSLQIVRSHSREMLFL